MQDWKEGFRRIKLVPKSYFNRSCIGRGEETNVRVLIVNNILLEEYNLNFINRFDLAWIWIRSIQTICNLIVVKKKKKRGRGANGSLPHLLCQFSFRSIAMQTNSPYKSEETPWRGRRDSSINPDEPNFNKASNSTVPAVLRIYVTMAAATGGSSSSRSSWQSQVPPSAPFPPVRR